MASNLVAFLSLATTPDPHMDGGNGVKTIVYNMKKDSKKGTQEKKD